MVSLCGVFVAMGNIYIYASLYNGKWTLTSLWHISNIATFMIRHLRSNIDDDVDDSDADDEKLN